MRKLILIAIIVILFASCQNPYVWPPPYVTFEEAIEFITEDYGEPYLIRDTVFYEDGTIRNRVAYWEIDPPELIPDPDDRRFGDRFYTSISMEAWNQPYEDEIKRRRQYGWEVLRWNKGNYTPVE